jgi:predicted nucleic acid-binding protein
MKLFCDTSVLVTALLESSEHHSLAKAVLQRVIFKDDTGYCSLHSLAETVSVLARLPAKPKLPPSRVFELLQINVIPHFNFVPLEQRDYMEALRSFSETSFSGGRFYDLLHLTAAQKVSPDQILTFNVNEWKMLAPNLAPLILSPN